MSINMDMSESTDYSDYRYQHTEVLHRDVNTGPENRHTIKFGTEPLESRGGLDVNEVAELVSLYFKADISPDDENQDGNDFPGTIQFRGVIGANLDSLTDMLEPSGAGSGNELSQTPTILEAEDESAVSGTLFGHDKDEVFAHFNTTANPGFGSQASGTGGGGSTHGDKRYIDFRQMTGRGPVLDSGDEISIISNLNFDEFSNVAEGTVRMTMVWDTAEVDDAGRQFSLPRQSA